MTDITKRTETIDLFYRHETLKTSIPHSETTSLHTRFHSQMSKYGKISESEKIFLMKAHLHNSIEVTEWHERRMIHLKC